MKQNTKFSRLFYLILASVLVLLSICISYSSVERGKLLPIIQPGSIIWNISHSNTEDVTQHDSIDDVIEVNGLDVTLRATDSIDQNQRNILGFKTNKKRERSLTAGIRYREPRGVKGLFKDNNILQNGVFSSKDNKDGSILDVVKRKSNSKDWKDGNMNKVTNMIVQMSLIVTIGYAFLIYLSNGGEIIFASPSPTFSPIGQQFWPPYPDQQQEEVVVEEEEQEPPIWFHTYFPTPMTYQPTYSEPNIIDDDYSYDDDYFDDVFWDQFTLWPTRSPYISSSSATPVPTAVPKSPSNSVPTPNPSINYGGFWPSLTFWPTHIR